MTKDILPISLLLLLGLLISSCDPEPVLPPTEEITTLEYTLTPTDGGAAVILRFVDLDGDGGDDPIITTEALEANQTYNGSLRLLNEAVMPIEEITLEIMEEQEEHQFFFQTTLSNLLIAYNDTDINGNPIGLSTVLMTADAESGSLTIILEHEPMKFADGVSSGDISNSGGDTDIEVTFPLDVQ